MSLLRIALSSLLICIPIVQPSADKKILDHDAYDIWRNLSGERIADSGDWVLYTLRPQDGDPVLEVRQRGRDATYTLEDGQSGRFDAGSEFVVYTIKPKKEAVRQAKRDKVKKDDMPKDGLGILRLRDGEHTVVESVKSFALPKDGGDSVAWLLEKAPKGEESTEETEPGEEEAEAETTASNEEEKKEEEKDKGKDKDKAEGTELVLRDLSSGVEHRFPNVTAYQFSDDGQWLFYSASNKSGDADGVYAVACDTGEMSPLLTGEGEYKRLSVDESGRRVAFLSNRDDFDSEQPAYSVYAGTAGDDAAIAVAAPETEGIPEGWWISEHDTPVFSDSGERLYFATAPRPAPEPEEAPLDEDQVKLDVWNWKDDLLQPDQLAGLAEEKKRDYKAVVETDTGKITQLATEAIPSVRTDETGDGAWALGTTNVPYRHLISWDSPGYIDVYLVHTGNGATRKVLERHQGSAQLSPGGGFVYWWDRHEREWYAMNTATARTVCITADIPHPLEDELNDRPMTPGAYGSGGWTENDMAMFVYDRHDIWLCDPLGIESPRCITAGEGRTGDLRFRVIDLDPELDHHVVSEPLLLSAFNFSTKESGFYRSRADGRSRPERLRMDDVRHGRPVKAGDADVLLFSRESFRQFPDLLTTDADFLAPKKMSEANPQQSEYRWGDARLVDWRSADGDPLRGILYTPDDFDPAKKYPLMVYFYERLSDGLHRHHAPQAGRASINISFYVSRGYLVFLPDVPYEIGYPGESALHAIVPGVLHLIEEGYVDRDRIGIQGHSWGGYQIAFMITRTNLFAAAEAGAPVANMTSAYGGIRWTSGLSRMFQYERTQSRIGGSLWERPLQYIENSPLFWADKIETPLLMLHNDRDGAVPWYQGIEMFVGMRRLEKPVWMLNYNGEDHGLAKYVNKRDFAIRMQQFFDHYLMDAPAPLWMVNGVPAVDKETESGLELWNGDE